METVAVSLKARRDAYNIRIWTPAWVASQTTTSSLMIALKLKRINDYLTVFIITP